MLTTNDDELLTSSGVPGLLQSTRLSDYYENGPTAGSRYCGEKEMTNIQELKAAANRSSALAGDVCNVLGACEQRLQQLETAVLPLYGDTARLQHIHQTQNYFNKNNPQSVELENINQLYNKGVNNLETAFEELLNRNTRPLTPTTLMDMIALEDDSSVESVSVSGSCVSSTALECMRKAKHILNRIEKRANKIMLKASQTLEQSTGLAIGPRRSVVESSHALCRIARHEQRQLLGLVPLQRLPALLSAVMKDCFALLAADVERQLLGLVPLQRLPALLSAVMKDCFALLAADVEVPHVIIRDSCWGWCLCRDWRYSVMKDCFALLAADVERQLLGLVPLQRLPALLSAVMKDCFALLAADVEVPHVIIRDSCWGWCLCRDCRRYCQLS
ncbi:putative exocyst complex component [Operophtera brumata]|uniref:Putative exocyst complex component n=1 Tax=Operophtera brumata TaxID=104452 RepID=A0A0L7KZS7_OPEBR|nr:putative exocyst complex component [Operophtera brumata]